MTISELRFDGPIPKHLGDLSSRKDTFLFEQIVTRKNHKKQLLRKRVRLYPSNRDKTSQH
jgi:hypothetical protein